MAIVKNENSKDSRSDGDISSASGDTLSSDDDSEVQTPSSVSISDDDGFHVVDDDDADSGAGSDDFDLSELGDIGAEFCLIGNWNCSVPFELYDLPDLSGVLSLDTWNNCLSEDERFSLAEYLPDMDQETFMHTLKELFAGHNFHFGNPIADLFNRLKGGLCEPRVALYRQGLNFFEKRNHYHLLRKYHNSMVRTLVHIRDAWAKCAGCGIEERLHILDIARSHCRVSMHGNDDGLGSESESSLREEYDKRFLAKGTNLSNRASYTVRPSLDVLSQEMVMTLAPTTNGKQNLKGILKITTPEASTKKGHLAGLLPSSANHGLGMMKYRPSASPLNPQAFGYDSGSAHRAWNQMTADVDDREYAYEIDSQKNRNLARGSKCSTVDKVRSLMQGKKDAFLKKYDTDACIGLGQEDSECYIGLPLPVKKENLHRYGRNRNVKQVVDVEILIGKPICKRSHDYSSRDAGKRAKHPEKPGRSLVDDGMDPAKGRDRQVFVEETQADWLAGSQPFRNRQAHQDDFSMDHPVRFDESNSRSKKQKTGGEFQTGEKNAVRSYGTISRQADHHHRIKALHETNRRISAQNGGMDEEDCKGIGMFSRIEETESDSSKEVDEDEDLNPTSYPSGTFEGGRSAYVKSADDPELLNKLMRSDKKNYDQLFDGVTRSSEEVGNLDERFPLKGTRSGKLTELSYQSHYSNVHLEGKKFTTSSKLVDDRKRINKSVQNGQMHDDHGRRSNVPFVKVHSAEKRRKGKDDLDYSMRLSDYMDKYTRGVLEEDDLHVMPNVNEQARTHKSGKKGKKTKAYLAEADAHEKSSMPLLGCNSITRKQKGKVDFMHLDGPDKSSYPQPVSQQPIGDPNFMKKQSKKKLDAESRSLTVVTSNSIISERAMADREPETKLPKKPFTLITPSVHTGFSFSIVHLLSAVRRAMITSNADDTTEVNRDFEKSKGGEFPSNENLDVNYPEYTGQKNLPSLTVQEIVNRVRSNPGDPCILETQEPLQDLVRGVLKIFLSKTAPLGAKAWKALVCYEKSTKSWSWIGPVSSSSLDRDMVEEETSSDAWGVPHKMLVKLVDAFANWLKSGQETLQQIGSLPAPPPMLPNVDEKERFKDLRAQKSLNTISPSSDEMRAYFRREEVLRYSIPDRAFSYTAADGRKSIVAPLRRCSAKAREHFMLKPDRPPHVTILCLVRDAAARLPGSIGTRADVCTLIRDSQYIVEDVSDAQINQVVSGALDRLHYERDPCVQFDGDRKLWVYLHRDREEEDFEDDGTSSTKKWKRPRKGTAGSSDLGTINDVGCQGTGDQVAGGPAIGYDFRSDLNIESSSMYAEGKKELADRDLKANMVDNIGPFIDSAQSRIGQGHPMGWEVLDLNPMRENKMLGQESFRNEDFDDEQSAGKGQLGVIAQSSMRRMDDT
ncbi:uncharacterized protein LOC131243171 [Magnolia sinica]|uniref:uncharacterized protein LOC131243171 n=1 Tax=Magnolia sinica TaxID=86752 RepID=UPI00265A0746|nr:uncharacterized protein LOC131243171 [Magnolia sinica]XP_058098299.1 uncharacterized protein LOC131243171 [Magnolia sinica]XP_058098300.1 uncharacterized protein LOC131243171 [Magnolia sinica]